MYGTATLKEPAVCTDAERREFERLVRDGFNGSDARLPDRIARARRLAFFRASDGELAAIAGLKLPDDRYRAEVFRRAGVTAAPDDYELELGWVFVVPAYRGSRIGSRLCERLLAGETASGLLATTRTDHVTMRRILVQLGFAHAGDPYPRRDEELVLYLRTTTRR